MRGWAIWLAVAGAIPARADSLPTAAAHEVVHVPAAADPVRGPRFAAVTIDLYLAFGPPAASAAWEVVRRAVERNPDAREVVHLTSYSSPGSDLALEAAMAAGASGRFFEFCDRLLRDRSPTLTLSELVRIGADVGLDAKQLEPALQAHTYRPQVEELRARAHGHIPGEVFVNLDRLWANEDALATAIQAARPRAQALLESGVPLSRLYERLLDERRKRQTDTGDSHGSPRRVQVDLSGAPARGPSLAPVTVIVFSNLSCAQCADLELLLARARDKHPGAIREVWKNWVPPYASFGLEATAAEFAVAAQNQGRFWELHDLALPARPSAAHPRPGKPELEQMARTVGMDLGRMADERRLGTLRVALERDQVELRRLGLNYSPSLLVNGVLLSGSANEARLEQLISDELARGVLDRLSGP